MSDKEELIITSSEHGTQSYFTLDKAKELLEKLGWTPPQEKKWEPKEGELHLHH